MYTSMISYDPILSNKFLGRSTQIYFFFLYYFQTFYRCLFLYDISLWKVDNFNNFFWEDLDSFYESFYAQTQRNFALIWKYYYLIYNYKTFLRWSNVYIYTHKDTLYLWSTYWQLWPKQKRRYNKKVLTNLTYVPRYKTSNYWLK